MKNIQKHIAAAGIFFLAICAFVPAQAQGTSADGDTVSVMGGPVPTTSPNSMTPMPPAENVAPVPSSTDAPVVPYARPQPLPPTIAQTPKSPEQGLMPSTSMEAVSGTSEGGIMSGDTGVTPQHSGTYYDSHAIVPDSDLVQGTRKVDPALEPGQKYIVVDKTRGASSFESQYVAATRALKLGRYGAAMEMFEKLHSKSPRDPRILMGLAVSQQGAGFNESAAQSYEDLLKVQPNNADAIVNLMGIMKTPYPSMTIDRLKELRSKYPNNPGIPAQLGLINAGLKNYDEAIRYLEVAASMEPRNGSHIYNIAIIKDKKGDAAGAIQMYERALQMDASYGDTATSLPREQIYDRLVVLRRKV